MSKQPKLPRATIYTDASKGRSNSSKSAWAAIILIEGKSYTRSGIVFDSEFPTIHEVEGFAVVQALQGLQGRFSIEIFTDSLFLVDIFSAKQNSEIGEFAENFKQSSTGKELIRLQSIHKIKWQWVKGHSGVKLNEACDRLANEIRKAAQ